MNFAASGCGMSGLAVGAADAAIDLVAEDHPDTPKAMRRYDLHRTFTFHSRV
jgi:hypothetical protein